MIFISYWDLVALSSLVVLLGVVLWLNGFKRVPSLYWSTTRMVAQLLFMGIWLTYVFTSENLWPWRWSV